MVRVHLSILNLKQMKKLILITQFIIVILLLIYGLFNVDSLKSHIVPYCFMIILIIINFYIVYRQKPTDKEGPFKDLPKKPN